MTQIEISLHDEVIDVIRKIRKADDMGVELIIPEGAVIFENILNLKLIEKEVENLDKVLEYNTTDEVGLNLIELLEGDTEVVESVSTLNPSSVESLVPANEMSIGAKHKAKLNVGMGFLPAMFSGMTRKVSAPTRMSGMGKIIGGLVVLGVIGGGIFAVSALQKATVNIKLENQPLNRSFSIKVLIDSATSPSDTVLIGETIETSVSDNLSMDTTGKKLVGEKAKGTVTVYNYTSKSKKISKGTSITYTKDDKDYIYNMSADVTVPEAVASSTAPGAAKTPGKKDVDVTAIEIGDTYNLSSDKKLEIHDLDIADFYATNTEKFEGGSSKEVKVVTQADLDALTKKLLEQNTDRAKRNLQNKPGTGKELVEGAVSVSVVESLFDKKLDEEADKVSLTQTVKAEGLVYSVDRLKQILGKLMQTVIPEGFVASEKSDEIKVEVLGNSDNTILSSKEADLQVTVKTYVLPKIDEAKLRSDLAGKSPTEAQKVIGGLRGILNYEVKISPNFPLMSKVPSNPSKIILNIEKN